MSSEFKDKRIAITGSFVGYSRLQLKRYLEENLGAYVVKSVTANTDLLLVGDRPGDTKMRAAERLRIRTVTDKDIPIHNLDSAEKAYKTAASKFIPSHYGTF